MGLAVTIRGVPKPWINLLSMGINYTLTGSFWESPIQLIKSNKANKKQIKNQYK
jgi:hypothetical protein